MLSERSSTELFLLAALMSSMEDTRIPDAIAAYAEKRAGKLVTKTDAAQLETQLGISVRISRQHGMTHVTWTTSGDKHSILLARSEVNVRWPSSQELRAKAPAYFSSREERNRARRALLNEHQLLTGTPDLEQSSISRAAAAISKLLAAQKELQQLTNYGQPMHVLNRAIAQLTEKN